MLHIVIGGDFNAREGRGDDTEAHPAARRHGFEEQNARGQWLLAWASLTSLKIANTLFQKQDDKLVTHTHQPSRVQESD